MKKLLSKAMAVIMAAALCVGMCATAFAASASDTGSITINGLTEGVTANAYQIAEATYDSNGNFTGYKMTVDGEFAFTIGSDGSYDEGALTEENLAALFEALNGAAATASAQANSEGIAVISNLPVGSYLIVITGSESVIYGMMIGSVYYDTDGVANGSFTVSNDTQVWAKSTTPSVEKTEHHSDGDATHSETTNVGDEITFDIIITGIPSYQGEYPEFEIDDQLTGLAISDDELDALTVKIVDLNGDTVATLTKGTDYTVDKIADDEFDVNFVVDGAYTLNSYAGLDYSIVIEYQATVTDDAYVNGEDTHENDVTLTYSTTSYASGNDGTDDDVDYEYDFKMTFTKMNGDNEALAGATFGLYTDEACTVAYTQSGEDVTAVSGEDGTVTFAGLDVGTYYLKEIAAPDGYYPNQNVYTVEIDAEIDENTGALTSWTITISGGDLENDITVTNTDETGLTIINTTTSALPSTGGMGTTIFYIIGGVLVAGAVVVLVTRRRMSHEA